MDELPPAPARDLWRFELELQTRSTWEALEVLPELDAQQQLVLSWALRLCWLQGYYTALEEPVRGELLLRHGHRVPAQHGQPNSLRARPGASAGEQALD